MPVNKDCELSIIIPVFNSSGFLRRSFDMFERNLDYSFEIIIVDDCSNDDSIKELHEIISHYSFPIRVIKKEYNSGPGVSRNIGIKKASGKYITFLDSDDFFSDSFFYSINSHIKNGVDCILFDYCTVSKTEKKKESIFFKGRNIDLSKKEDLLVFVRGSTCGKIYRKDIIINNDIKFLEQYRNEDLPFTKEAIAHCNSFVYVDKSLYNYYQNKDSLMHNQQLTNKKNAINACEELSRRLSARYYSELMGILILEYVYSLSLTIAATQNKQEWLLFIENVKKQFPTIKSNEYYSRYSYRVRFLFSESIRKHYLVVKMALWMRKMKDK